MRKIAGISILMMFVMFFNVASVSAFPLPNIDEPRIIQEIKAHTTAVQTNMSESMSLEQLVQQEIMQGIPGFMDALQLVDALKPGNLMSMAQGMGMAAMNHYKGKLQQKVQEKKKALADAKKDATDKLKGQKDADKAARAAVRENRKKASKNRTERMKKWFNWRSKSNQKKNIQPTNNSAAAPSQS